MQLLNYRIQKRIKHTYQFNSIHKIFGLIHLGFYVCMCMCVRVRVNKVIIQLNGKNYDICTSQDFFWEYIESSTSHIILS